MIIKLNDPKFRQKNLFLDYDWTMVSPKNNKIYPKNVDDWEWLYEDVPEIIIKYYDKGFSIFVMTNQRKEWKKEQIINVCKTLKIPITICISTNKNNDKPNLYLFKEAFTPEQEKKINYKQSLMCGDSLGRKGDHSDYDLIFAKKIGVEIIPPEKLFYKETSPSISNIGNLVKGQVIIMVGYPGSGKSTIAKDLLNYGYFIIDGDTYKTSTKMIKIAQQMINEGTAKKIIFDATNLNPEKRKEYINFSVKNNLTVQCIYVDTSMHESMARNNLRENPVPKIAYLVLNKTFQKPNMNEGYNYKIITI